MHKGDKKRAERLRRQGRLAFGSGIKKDLGGSMIFLLDNGEMGA